MPIRALALGGLLASSLLVVVLGLRLLAGPEEPASPWPGARIANGIAPRWTSLDQVAGRLGPPAAREPCGRGLARATFRLRGRGVAELTLWLDEDGYVRWARLVPDAPQALAAVERDLEGFGAPLGREDGELRRYPRGLLRVSDGRVHVIWIANEGVPPGLLAGES